jgi:hypothetical protein
MVPDGKFIDSIGLPDHCGSRNVSVVLVAYWLLCLPQVPEQGQFDASLVPVTAPYEFRTPL